MEKETEKEKTCAICGSDKDLIFIDGSFISFEICEICYNDILENEKKVQEVME